MVNETCQKSKDFLAEIIADLRFDLTVSAEITPEGCLLNMSGEDSSLLLNESGEMLDAFETLLFQIFGRELDKTERFVCDADGFRKTRKAELQAMARFAAQNVRKSGKPFTFGKLNSTERRMIHLTLVNEADLQTESIGEGRDRHLQVKLK
jgi:spoIIIJ-associated protein